MKQASKLVSQLIKIYLDTKRVKGWNEIDAFQLVAGDESTQWVVKAFASSTFQQLLCPPTKYTYSQITIVATIAGVRLLFEETLIAQHQQDWDLPVCLGILHRRLEAELQGVGTREFIKVLRLLERQSKELKRRTRAAGLFPNEESLQRLVIAVLVELSGDCGTRMRYLTI